MKCLEMKAKDNASTLLKNVLVGLVGEQWVWFSGSGEAYYNIWDDEELFKYGNPMTTTYLMERLHEKATIIFLNLKAFKEEKELPHILTGEHFIETKCLCSIGVVDSTYIAIFMKDEQLLNRMYERSIAMNVEYARIIEYKTNPEDEYSLFLPW